MFQEIRKQLIKNSEEKVAKFNNKLNPNNKEEAEAICDAKGIDPYFFLFDGK